MLCLGGVSGLQVLCLIYFKLRLSFSCTGSVARWWWFMEMCWLWNWISTRGSWEGCLPENLYLPPVNHFSWHIRQTHIRFEKGLWMLDTKPGVVFHVVEVEQNLGFSVELFKQSSLQLPQLYPSKSTYLLDQIFLTLYQKKKATWFLQPCTSDLISHLISSFPFCRTWVQHPDWRLWLFEWVVW